MDKIRQILKWFLIVIGSVIVLTFLGLQLFKLTYKPTHLQKEIDTVEVKLDEITEKKEEEEIVDVEEVLPLTEEEKWHLIINNSDRVNVLLFGTDGFRADTLIFVSYSKEKEDVTMITIPRDTKNVVEGMDGLGHDKINAVFCFPDGKGGSENQKIAIEKLLNVPIHYYVKVNYNGLKAIVNTIGGVEINVPFDMDYDDIWAEPELHIHLKKGVQTLNGDTAMQYIRWRKNNDQTGDSDLARGKRQQEFIIKVLKKSFGLNIVDVINVSYNYVRTDMDVKDLLYYGTELIGFDLNTINKFSLPGEADNFYFYQDLEATKELMEKLYE